MEASPAQRRDYYDVLGVSRDADADEITRAFRSLAREIHPDISSSPEADEHFTEVAEAYAVLSKPEKRLLYDRFGVRGRSRGFSDRLLDAVLSEAPTTGADLVAELELGHFEAVRGTTRTLRLEAVAMCPRCGGDGRTGERSVCRSCAGSGRETAVSENETGRLLQVQACGECGASGLVGGSPCGRCAGEGTARVSRTLRVRIPAGVTEGQTVRVRGEGVGADDGSPPGDAFVVLHVQPPPLERRGLRLAALVGLAITLALLVKLLLG